MAVAASGEGRGCSCTRAGARGAGSSLRTPQPQTWLCRLHPKTPLQRRQSPRSCCLRGSASPQLWFPFLQPSPSSACRRCGHPRYKTSFSGLFVRGCRLSSSQILPAKPPLLRGGSGCEIPQEGHAGSKGGTAAKGGNSSLARAVPGELYLALGYQSEPWSLCYVVGAAGRGLPGARGTVSPPPQALLGRVWLLWGQQRARMETCPGGSCRAVGSSQCWGSHPAHPGVLPQPQSATGGAGEGGGLTPRLGNEAAANPL